MHADLFPGGEQQAQLPSAAVGQGQAGGVEAGKVFFDAAFELGLVVDSRHEVHFDLAVDAADLLLSLGSVLMMPFAALLLFASLFRCFELFGVLRGRFALVA